MDDEPTDDFNQNANSRQQERDEISQFHDSERSKASGSTFGIGPIGAVSAIATTLFPPSFAVKTGLSIFASFLDWAFDNKDVVSVGTKTGISVPGFSDSRVASNSSKSPVARQAAVDRVAAQAEPSRGYAEGGPDGGGDRPRNDAETPSAVAAEGGSKKKVVARRHRIGNSGRGTSTLLTGPLGVVGGARVERKKLLGS